MATYARSVRRGLPRAAGGDPWPPAEAAAAAANAVDRTPPAAGGAPEESSPGNAAAATPTPLVAADAAADAAPDAAPDAAVPPAPARPAAVRRGLPRTPGGAPWPPAPESSGQLTAAVSVTPAQDPAQPPAAVAAEPVRDAAAVPVPASPAAAADEASVAASRTEPETHTASVRRGLPRTSGGQAWPPAGTVPAASAAPESPSAPAAAEPALEPAPAPTAAASAPAGGRADETRVAAGPREPLRERPLAHAGVAGRPEARPEPPRHGPFTKAQWAGIVLVGGGALLYAAALAVLAVRWILSLEPLQEFLTTYPGEYHLPEGAPVGFPAWLNWTHFLNAFFMVLIIRTGLQVRSEKRPSAFWISKKNRKRKMSLTLWLHQALDVLWLANGLVFLVLLFATGQWMRVVPTSWEVFPNALSAALQYVSLDWPTENGWVNYNALQQLAYFATIFIAAPVAAITGYRMSALWPKNATTLNRLYPVEWARKLHFPTMLYFVVFIVVHVALVLSTGALRNLNHMYAAQGSDDPAGYAENWTGFWLFALSVAVTVAAYVAMRPLVVAPIARLFGNVSSR